MTITVDINLFMDVFLNRQPHCGESASVIGLVSSRAVKGVCASHGLTTIYYLLRKARGSPAALSAVDQLLRDFIVAGLDQHGWILARRMAFRDFEDSGVAQVVLETGSSWIVTRNTADFQTSPVPAVTPSDFLVQVLPNSPPS